MNISIAINTITRGLMAAGINGSSRAGVPTPSLDLDFINSETLDPRITFSRASNATRINSAGVLEYAPHNLLTYSEQFDNAAWDKNTTVTVSANTTVAPNVTTTADKIVETTTTGLHRIYITTPPTISANVLHTLSGYFKASERSIFQLFLSPGGGVTYAREFNLSNGTDSAVSGVTAPLSSVITDVGNGWYRCSISGVVSGTFGDFQVRLCNSAGNNSYTGTAGSGLFIWGAQLNVGALQPYYPTTVKNLLGFSEAFENAAWTKSNSFVQTNLLTWSQDFDNAAWTKTSSSITANTTAAPDGTLTADSLIINNGATGDITRLVTISNGVTYTLSAYVKSNGAPSAGVIMTNMGGASYGVVNLSTGVSSSAGTAISASAVNVGNGWYRVSVTGLSSSTNTTAYIYPVSTGITPYTGNGSSGIYVWGAQLVPGSTAGDYQQTFSAALPVMYKAPNGLMTADKLVETTATDQHIISQTATVSSGAVVTSSFYLKAVERSRVRIIIYNNASVGDNFSGFFNLSDGTFISSAVSGTGVFTSSSVVSLGNGWYLCSITGNVPTATTYQSRLNLIASGTTISYTGDGTSGIYIWGAQLSDSASLDTYVNNPGAAPTAAAYYGPRFNYDPVTLSPQGLLIEEQRTNSIRNNTGVGAVAGTPGTLPTNWSRSSYAGMSIDVVGTGTESGITYIDCRFVGTAGASSHSLNLDAVGGIAAVTGQTWTLSSFVSIVSGSTSGITAFRIVTAEFTSGGAFVTSNVTAITPTTSALITQRLSATQTLSGGATTASVVPSLNLTYTNGAAIDITLRIGLPQLELGAFATSAIPTTTAAATRSADVATITGSNFSGFYNQNEGTLFGEVALLSSSYTGGVALDVGAGGAFGTTEYLAWNGTQWGLFPNSAPINVTSVVTTTVSAKVAGGLKLNDSVISANGLIGTVDTSCAIPASATTMSLGVRGWTAGGGNYLNGTIKKIGYYPTRLSNAQLQNITS